MRETPTAAGRDALRQLRAERAGRHDEATLRECGIDVPGRSRVPPVRDPWADDDDLRAAKGVTLGTALSLGVWTLVALVALLVLAVLA